MKRNFVAFNFKDKDGGSGCGSMFTAKRELIKTDNDIYELQKWIADQNGYEEAVITFYSTIRTRK
jgi:hypothetical protein